jgi:Spy/CpxP family protein refolding chaperone
VFGLYIFSNHFGKGAEMLKVKLGHMFVVAALLGLASWAMAQEGQSQGSQPPERGRGRWQGRWAGGEAGMTGGPAAEAFRLLRLEEIQKELQLTDEQKAKLRDLAEKSFARMREEWNATRDLSPEERRKKAEELRAKSQERFDEIRKKIEEILLPFQIQRLKEIRVQMLGVRALRDAEVAKALGLTDEQKEKLQAIEKESREKMQSFFGNVQNLSPEERRAKFNQMRDKFREAVKETQEKALKVLTPAQLDALEKLKGKKVDIDLSRLYGPPRQGEQPGRSEN